LGVLLAKNETPRPETPLVVRPWRDLSGSPLSVTRAGAFTVTNRSRSAAGRPQVSCVRWDVIAGRLWLSNPAMPSRQPRARLEAPSERLRELGNCRVNTTIMEEVMTALFSKLDLSDSRLPRGLVESIRCGRPICIPGRNSGESGRAAIAYAVDDLLGAADELARKGVDIREALPQRQVMLEDLRAATPISTDRLNEGKKLSHRIVEYDFVAEWGFHLILCAGSGKQLDPFAGQPWISRLLASVQHHNSGLVFAKEIHRIARVAWAAGPLMSWIQATGCFIGSGDREIRLLDNATSASTFFDLQASEEVARKLPLESRRGMAAKTAPAMVGGQVEVGVGHVPPPGLAVVRMKGSAGRGHLVMFLDSPDFRPDEAQVAEWFPSSVDAEGEPADSVAAVKWLLAHAYTEGLTKSDLMRELIRRGFSTQKMRYHHARTDITIGDLSHSNALGVIRTVCRHLEFYRTGVLRFPFGIDGLDDVVITGCCPPGGWATPADFARIAAGLDADESEARPNHLYWFAGLPVSIGDDTFVLRSRSLGYKERLSDPDPAYYFEARDATKRAPGFSLGHAEIAQWFAGGIAAAGDRALSLVGSGVTSTLEIELVARRTRLKAEREVLLERERDLLSKVEQTSGALLERLESIYNREVAPGLADAAAALAEVDREISHERARTLMSTSSVAAERLLELVAQLAVPRSAAFRSILLAATREVRYERLPQQRRGVQTLVHRLTGKLVIGTGDEIVELPLDRTWESGAGVAIVERAPEILEELRAGVPFHALTTPLSQYARSDVAKLLGVRSEELLLPRIRDGRISRAVMHVVYERGDRSLGRIARQLGEPVAFVERIAELYVEQPPAARWLRGNAKYLAALYASAAHNEGLGLLGDIRRWGCTKRAHLTIVAREAEDDLSLVRGVGYQVPPCSTCGSHELVPLKIWEPVGPVCASCRTDRRGLKWSADPYDEYIAEPGIWALASAEPIS